MKCRGTLFLFKYHSGYLAGLDLLFIFLLFACNPAVAQPTDGLLLQLELDGNYADSSPNNYNLNGFNGAFVANGQGNAQGALSANGDNTYVKFPNIPELKPDFPITMACRAKFDYLDGTQIVVGTDFGINTHSGATIQVASTGQIAVSYGNAQGGFNGSSRHGKIANYELEIDTWYTIVTIIRGYEDIDIYINCELQPGYYTGSATSIGYTDASGSLCRKRGNPESITPPYYLGGDIDYFYYWDRELSPEEIVPLCSICDENLVVSDIQGCINTVLNYDFDFSGNISDIDEVLWTFADGTTSSDLATTKSYSTVGSFSYTLETSLIDGCTYSVEGNTEISETPEPPALPDTISLCEGESYFQDFSDFTGWDEVIDPSGNSITSYTFDTPGLFNFSFLNTCGQFEESIEIIATSSTDELEIQGISEIEACPNQPFTPDLDASLFGNTYVWTPSTGLSDPTVLNPQISVSEPITYTLTAANPCTADASFELSVDLVDPINFELIPEITICSGDTVEVPGQLNSEATVAWANSNSLSVLDIPNPLAFPTVTTTYQVAVSNACETVNETIEVVINEAPSISGIANLDLCVGDTAYPNIQNTGNLDVDGWHWSPATGIENTGSANPGIFNEHNTLYQVQATNECGTDIFDVQLNTYSLDADLDLDSIVCPGSRIELAAGGAASYSWFPSDAMTHPHDSITTAHIYSGQLIQLQLSGGTCTKMFSDFVAVYEDIGFTHLDAIHLLPGEEYDVAPLEFDYNISFEKPTLFSFTADTILPLTYTDTNGCEFYLYLPVIIEPALYIPNGFTPDGDGLNDIFKAVGVNIETFEMQIFNRHGKLVFQSNSINQGWNGGIDGYYCPDDLYNYLIKYSYHTTEVKLKRGFVTLVR